MAFSLTADQLTQLVGASTTSGSTDRAITGIGSLNQAQAGDLSFLGNKKYTPDVAKSNASVILVPMDFEGQPAENQLFIKVENPSMALALVCKEIEGHLWPKPESGIHPSAVVAETATIDPSATLGPGVIVGEHSSIGPNSNLEANVVVGNAAKVGADCWIKPNVTIGDYCSLGDRVRLHAGVVLGSDGFGYETVDGVHQKVPQIGEVIIEDDVEIGANSTIDRARFNVTRIGAGTKIDNLVQIAHNVETGKHCIIVAQTGIGGSTILENNVVTAGQAGIAGHLKLSQGTVIAAKSGLHNNTLPGQILRGIPAIEAKLAHRTDVLKKRLPELFKRVAKLEEQLEDKES